MSGFLKLFDTDYTEYTDYLSRIYLYWRREPTTPGRISNFFKSHDVNLALDSY